MSKKIKNLSVLTVAVLAGLFITLSSIQVKANQVVSANNNNVTATVDNNFAGVIAVADISNDGKCGEGKCGEGKCGNAAKETKKEGAVKTEKKAKTTATEGKCGEGKCGAAEKKEGKAAKKESKTEKKGNEKCGTGKCGVA